MDWAQVLKDLVPLLGVALGAALTTGREGRQWNRESAMRALDRCHSYWSRTVAIAEQLAMAAGEIADPQIPQERRVLRIQEAIELSVREWRPLVYRREFEAREPGAKAIFDMDSAFVELGMIAMGDDEAATTRAAAAVRQSYIKVRNQASIELEEADANVGRAYGNWATRAWARLRARKAPSDVTTG